MSSLFCGYCVVSNPQRGNARALFLFLRNNYFENGNKTKKDETIKCYFSLSLGCSRFLSFLRIGLVRECVLPQLFSPTVTAMTSARRRPIGAGCFRCVNTKRRRILMPRTARPSVVVIFFCRSFANLRSLRLFDLFWLGVEQTTGVLETVLEALLGERHEPFCRVPRGKNGPVGNDLNVAPMTTQRDRRGKRIAEESEIITRGMFPAKRENTRFTGFLQRARLPRGCHLRWPN